MRSDHGVERFLRFFSLPHNKDYQGANTYKSKVQRGFDPTFEPPNDNNAKRFHDWAQNSPECKVWKVKTDKVYAVHDSKGRRYLCSADPVIKVSSLICRGTRCFFGMDDQSMKPVFINDPWRLAVDGIHDAGGTYRFLAEEPNAVEDILEVFDSHDVEGKGNSSLE